MPDNTTVERMTQTTKDDDVWHPGLQCHVKGIAYDFVNRGGRLDMSANECCDMDGCLELFRSISPEVRLIETFAGSKRDTMYLRGRDGVWAALSLSRAGWER
jgi:hypothetical protein